MFVRASLYRRQVCLACDRSDVALGAGRGANSSVCGACTRIQLLRKRIPVTRLDLGDLSSVSLANSFSRSRFDRTPVLWRRKRNNRSTVPSGISTISVTSTPEGVVSFQISGFRRQIDNYRPCYAFIEELGVRRGVKKAKEIGRLVEDANILFVCRLPFRSRSEIRRSAR